MDAGPKVLIVRNDKLGDFMLAYPSFALLKGSLPGAEVYALVPEYTREMAETCPWIDGVVIDSGQGTGAGSAVKLSRSLRQERFDAVIALYSTTRVGLAAALARIPYRLAPATKIAQVFFNRRLKQRRSRSEKPESEYNLDLIRRFLEDSGIATSMPPDPPYLHFPQAEIDDLANVFRAKHSIEPDKKLVFLHAGSGGSAPNLSRDQFAGLASELESKKGHVIVLMAGPGEEGGARALSKQMGDTPNVVYVSDQGLKRFAQHIAFADVFISGSTGTLHIAGALDRPTAAFYSGRRSATALRWRTLNSPGRRLAFEAPAEAVDMSGIDVEAAAREISERFLQGI